MKLNISYYNNPSFKKEYMFDDESIFQTCMQELLAKKEISLQNCRAFVLVNAHTKRLHRIEDLSIKMKDLPVLEGDSLVIYVVYR